MNVEPHFTEVVNFCKKWSESGVGDARFLNQYNHTLDAKNRLFIPAKFREALGSEFVIFKGPEKCLYVYDNETFLEISKQFIDEPDPLLQRSFFSQVERVSPDKQGRVTLAADQVEYAGLVKEAAIVGSGQRIEIWAAEEITSQIRPLNQFSGIRKFKF